MAEQYKLCVPIIHQDLRPEETIVQTANALEYLSHAVNQVFQHIEDSVARQTKQLAEIQKRGEIVRAKVEKLASANNKATIVFSSAKYPASDVNRDYSFSFNPPPLPPFDFKVKYHDKPLLTPSDDFSEKLKFYHVKVGSKLLRKNMDIAIEEGLGSLPPDLASVSSLLLFNTAENLYKKYVMLDPLGVASKMRLPLEGDNKKQELDAAPISLSRGDQPDQKSSVNYFYAPTLEEVPQIDVPLDLPDLPGIADDLRYSVDFGAVITPSQAGAGTPAIVELPPLPDLEIPTDPDVTKAAAPPPPPPPPVLESPPSPPHPPPPPPPPPPLADVDSGIVSVAPPSKTPKPSVAESSPDAHATLMEAIRKAGGSGSAKLRSIMDRKIEAKRLKQEEKEIGSAGGDLIAELYATLEMRRKGISGHISENSVMGKISAMIPPPRPKESETEDDTNDDDDDPNDWDD